MSYGIGEERADAPASVTGAGLPEGRDGQGDLVRGGA
jgi:hypothetical protein